MNNNLEIKKSIWNGKSGPLLIAEIGGNHEGDFSIAKQMTRSAIKSGVDCIKFQLYRGDTLVNPLESPERNKHFKKFELTKKEHIQLAEMCSEANVIYNASVWDLEMLDWIDDYLDFYKIGSGDLTAFPIIKEFAKRGKPILLSTGLSTTKEVLQTITYIQKINKVYLKPEMLCVMQCTSMYPISDSDANLCVMDQFKSLTGLSVGYSDHTIGSKALQIAASMGAKVLEFHFTESREGKLFRDHMISLTKNEVVQLIKDIKQITILRGKNIKKPEIIELDNNHHISFRRGVYVNKPIKKGQLIKQEDLTFLRPCSGTDCRDFELVIGSKALKSIKSFQPIYINVDYSSSK